MSNIDLHDYALDLFTPNATGIDLYDIDAMRDAAIDLTHQTADDLVSSSYANAESIIDRYEREAGDVEDFGQSFKASEYLQAMTAYAYAVATAVLWSEIADIESDLETARESLGDEWGRLYPDADCLADCDIRVTGAECPYGWAAHDYENDTSDGKSSVMVWKSGQLDGGNGMAVQCGRIWLYVGWTGTPENSEHGEG